MKLNRKEKNSVLKEMGTDTSALVGCSIGQVLHNLIWDFHSLPGGVPIFMKDFKYLLKKRGYLTGKGKGIYHGATRTHLSVPLLHFQVRFLYSLLRQESLTETAIGHLEEKISNNTFSWSSSGTCKIISIIRDKEN